MHCNEKKKLQDRKFLNQQFLLKHKKIKDTIEISVKDNGNGIPKKVLDKIFQPFFTTKPTGQGTGLGLSLSYDIIKAHSGNLHVTTEAENKGPNSQFHYRYNKLIMKINKKMKTEVLKVYDTWLHSYLNGDVNYLRFLFG